MEKLVPRIPEPLQVSRKEAPLAMQLPVKRPRLMRCLCVARLTKAKVGLKSGSELDIGALDELAVGPASPSAVFVEALDLAGEEARLLFGGERHFGVGGDVGGGYGWGGEIESSFALDRMEEGGDS